MSKDETALKALKKVLIQNNTIDSKLYEKFEVKRGLRHRDGSGVLAGLSHISSVLGFHKIEGEIHPIDGILKYREVPLDQIMALFNQNSRHCFERICFLLLVGKMPNEKEFEVFLSYMKANRGVPKLILDNVIKNIPSKNIMNKLQTAISALYAFDDDPDNLDPLDNLLKAIRIIAKLPLIVGYSYLAAYKKSPKYVNPESAMSQAEAFLYVLNQGKKPSKMEAYILDLCLILHAEHGGGNNSTFTTYVVTSSGSDIYCTLASAVASLKGPLHGAANKKVMEMMADIKLKVKDWTNKKEVSEYLTKLVKKQAGDKSGKLFGLGHAVYTKSDPRAVAIKGHATRLAKDNEREDELTLYNLVAEEGPSVFTKVKKIEKIISPNVDFYSGFVYDCLNIPQEIYTPIFAMARACGWASHRIEEMISGRRIIRPGYKHVPYTK